MNFECADTRRPGQTHTLNVKLTWIRDLTYFLLLRPSLKTKKNWKITCWLGIVELLEIRTSNVLSLELI